MIFVTVGTQFPFQRLVSGVDAWASRQSPRPNVFAQVGEHEGKLAAIDHEAFVDAVRCDQLIDQSDVVVAHAGVGTVLTALSTGRPVIVMPRRADLNEHRNDHQLDTVKWMRHLDGVTVVESVEELESALNAFTEKGSSPVRLGATAEPQLLQAISSFVAAAPTRRRSVWFNLTRAAWRAVISLARRGDRGQSAEPERFEHSVDAVPALSPESSPLAAEMTAEGEPADAGVQKAPRRKPRLASAAAL